MAERSVRRRDQADNKPGPPRPIATIGPRRANSMVARSTSSTHEAGYTTAADPLSPRMHAPRNLAHAEESIYSLL
jgi:hypothetical protein